MAGRPGMGLAVAESLTSGGVQARVGSLSGASVFFRGGITAYTLEQKVRHLGVHRESAAACNCVSDEVARQMARGAALLFEADIAVATTGYAEPWPAEKVEVPYAWWALAERLADGQWLELSGRVECPEMDRAGVQALVSDTVLAALITHLEGSVEGTV